MYVSRVRLRNIKGFHGVRNVDLDLRRPGGGHAGWTVLAGRNASGKSSFLRSVALAIGGVAVARSLVPDFDNWISSGQGDAAAEVLLSHDPRWERFRTGQPPDGPFWAGLAWNTPPPAETAGFRRSVQPALTELIASSSARTAARRGPWQDNPTGWFCAAYGPFRRLLGGAGDSQRLMTTSGPVARMASLFHEDASLAEGVGWLIDQHLRALEGREGAEQLKDAALAVLADGLLPDDYTVDTVDSDGLWVTSNGHRFPLREMSDGYRAVAALVVDLLKQLYEAYGRLSVEPAVGGSGTVVSAPGVVIIDEVDAHLHVSWQKRIGTWLKAHFPQIQFIVTTHSPYICQAADPSGLIRLPGPGQERPPETVDDDLWERIVYGSGDDAVLSDLFGLDNAYSERATVLRDELVGLEMLVMKGHASRAQLTRYHELRARLTSSPVARVDEVAARFTRESTEGR